ncbi:MAG: M23 family metallopeptidase [Candidatus Cohnella colombiensis]|uniref:M23 family metallopeptidase n=1 Tax=Candidatus Cohnella colombiensis TaxID=3121368 RepID=A0AA95JEP9_9BACL|nr:MAG: M23 family metallopeptidase [Cohnella sp.]
MKWRRKRFTFMVIPDANSSVKRFQLSALWITIGFLLIIAILISAITMFLLYRNNTEQIGVLEKKLATSTTELEKIIQNKDLHIGVLQTEVTDLSEQAQSITNHMSDIKDLESQLKNMVGIKDGDIATAIDANSVDDAYDGIAMDGGTGGEDLPVFDEAMDQLISETRQTFTSLQEQVKVLRPELEQTKEAVLKQSAIIKITPTIWPTDSRKVTSLFGVRKDPFTRRATFHAGIDIGGSTGDPIYATADGKVTSAGRDSSHGKNILISHTKSLSTHYSHMSKLLVEAGAKVSKGDLIGYMGSTGRSTGPHLHYEVILNGSTIDPRPYLKATRREN